jgi:cell division protein FtsQ
VSSEKKKGASRKPAAKKQTSRRARGFNWKVSEWPPGVFKILRWLRGGLILAALGVMLNFAGQWLMIQLDKPVTSVKIRGEFLLVSRQQVADQVYEAMGSSFMTLKLDNIKAQLERQPWIDRVRVERRWPDQLEVTVIEHKPIARWGASDALNHRGEVIELKQAQDERVQQLLQGLPRLSGLSGMEAEVMEQYQTLSKMLSERGLVLAQLQMDATRSWSATLEDGTEINIGREQVAARAKRFLKVYERQLKQRWAELDRIDLRYFNGVAVHWRQAQ